jgi:galactose-1-phosphate uridylyltransferase
MCALCNHAKDDLDEDTAKIMYDACKKYNDDIEKAIAYIMLCSDVGMDHIKVRKHMTRFFASEVQRALAFN